jgi:hypothetical protein
MQLPFLPPTPQVHGPPGPQTIGCEGAASPTTLQSESVAQGFCTAMQMPQPEGAPPGLHDFVDGQSVFELQVLLPASAGQESPVSLTVHVPSHDAKTLHP